MNFRSRWRNGRTPSIGSAGASLTTPVIISGATSPAARAIARMRPVRIDGMTAGSTTRERRLELGRAEGERRLAHAARDRGEPLLGGHDHDRHGQQRQRERRPQDAAGAERRRRQRLGEEEAVDRAADEVDEEAEAEDAEHDRGHAGQVVDRDAHQRSRTVPCFAYSRR